MVRWDAIVLSMCGNLGDDVWLFMDFLVAFLDSVGSSFWERG